MNEARESEARAAERYVELTRRTYLWAQRTLRKAKADHDAAKKLRDELHERIDEEEG